MRAMKRTAANRHRLAACLVAVLASAGAQAGRPLVTEDAFVPGDGDCAVETYAALNDFDDAATQRTLSAQFGCGIGWRTQVQVAGARTAFSHGHADALTLAGKTALAGDGKDSVQWSLAYGVTAVQSDGVDTRVDQRYATLVATVAWSSSLSMHMNLGWTGASHPSHSITRWAVAFDQALGDDAHLVAETFADDCDRSAWLQAGGWIALTPQISLNASYGRQRRDSTTRMTTLGLTIAF